MPLEVVVPTQEDEDEDEDESAEMDESGDEPYPELGNMTDDGSFAIMQPSEDFVATFQLARRIYPGTILPTKVTFHDSLNDAFTPTIIEAYYRPRFIRYRRRVTDHEMVIAQVRLHFKVGLVVYELISSGQGYSIYLVRVDGVIKLVNIID